MQPHQHNPERQQVADVCLNAHTRIEPTEQQVTRFAPAVETLRTRLEGNTPSPRAANWIQVGVPQPLAAAG